MNLLVLIFGIMGWIYNYRPLLRATLVTSICGLLVNSLVKEEMTFQGYYINLLIFIAGIITSLVRMLRQK